MRLLKIYLLLLFPFLVKAQDCCDTDNVSVVCYTASADYCPSGAFCRYTLDAQNMTGLNQKLNNPVNFGPNGISPCDITLAPLQNINSVDDIENLNCDIIIIGNFALDNNAGFGTHLETSFLNIIRDWSLKCTENLTILFQGEAEVWGYEIQNQNQNPNSSGGVQDPNIFDGVFGSLNQFNQGGSFQANFSTLPATGSTILAVDGNGRPTIVLDDITNDIILADVGIMCNGSGDVTNSPNVTNANDILACNLIALGCEIAGVEEEYEELAFICQGESYTLPDGQTVDIPGTYPVSLIGADDCDSTIVTYLDFSIPQDSVINYIGCEGDGYFIEVGNDTYDQAFPSGSTMLQNIYNCDSMVIVDLVFHPNTSGMYDKIVCFNETTSLHGFSFVGGIDTSIIIANDNGCDSLIEISLEELSFDNVIITDAITIENNKTYVFDNTIPSNYDISWSPSSGLSCDDCINPIFNNVENISPYIVTVVSPDGCESVHEINIDYSCNPYVPNVFSPHSISGNNFYAPLAPCQLEDYSIEIYDRWGSLVFQTTDQEETWNGKFKNQFVPSGIYVYLLKYANQGNERLESGTLSVMF